MTLPKHIAFIVDGNRRWARKKRLPELSGHKKVSDQILHDLVYHAKKLKIPYLTFWLFSTENWRRGARFYNPLFGLIEKQLIEKNIEKYLQDGIRFNLIGDLSKLPQRLVKNLEDLEKKSCKNKKIIVTFALNYGGRDEIIRAIKKLAPKKKNFDNLTIKEFEKYLDTHDLPDPDLVIRTGGAKRLSGFLLWQLEYSELYFTKVLFPDFNLQEFDKALQDFASRKRRYGR